MTCVCCGLDGSPLPLHSGADIGPACAPCRGLVWEAHAARVWGGAEDRADVQWEWRRRRAAVQELPFALPPPRSQAQRSIETWLATRAAP